MNENDIARSAAAAEKAFPYKEGSTIAVINAFREAFIMGYNAKANEK